MSFLDDMAALLVTQGIGVLGVNIFESSASLIPLGMGPYLSLTDTGGLAPTRVQNTRLPNTQRPTAQVLVRAGHIAGVQEAYPAARAMAQAAYQALDGNFNVMIGGVFYLSVQARQEITDMGLDATGNRVQVIFNIVAEKFFS